MLDAAQIAGLNCLRLMNETTAGWYGWRSLGTGCGRFLQVSKCCCGINNNNNNNNIALFPLQLHWHMGSINRIFLLPRRKQGMLSLWTWAILDTKHQCVPLIRANSRCEETAVNMSNTRNRPICCLTLLALSSRLPDTVHCF